MATKDKPWYLSKSMWAGLVILGISIYEIFLGEIPNDTFNAIVTICIGFGIVGIRQAFNRK